MHIEPGIVEAGKIGISYVSAGASIAMVAKVVSEYLKNSGVLSLFVKSVISTFAVLFFFQILPHTPVGVSEVHLIMGSTLFLILGLAPASIGLALGLLAQGMLFSPTDLPQYGMNVTTLLVPMMSMALIAKSVIPANVAYKDLTYSQALKLSTTYQAGVVAFVSFWVFYGQGFGSEVLASVSTFSIAYLSVILIEPIVDLAVLALVKYTNTRNIFIEKRVFAIA